MRTGIGETEHERCVYGSTSRMNRAGRSTGTARRPLDAWNPVERETNSRQNCNVSLTRLAIRDVLWSFIFIPHVLPCRFLIARKRSGLVGRSTTVPALDRAEPRVPRRAPDHLFPQVMPSRFLCLLPEPPGHHIVDCRANAYAKSGPSRAKSRRGKGSGDPHAPSPNVRPPKCFNLDICGSGACGRHETPSPRCTKGPKNFLGIFPNMASASCVAGSAACTADKKRGMFQARYTNAGGGVFSYQKWRFSPEPMNTFNAGRPCAVCIMRFFLQQ